MLKYVLAENAMALETNSCIAISSIPESKNPDNVINYMIAGGTPVRSIVETVIVKGFKMNRIKTARHVSTVRELSKQTETRKATVLLELSTFFFF